MKNSVAFQSIASFTAWEALHFRKWLLSTVHNTRPELAGLFDYLRECTLRQEVMPEPEKAFQKVFTGQSFDEKKMRHALSWLMAQIKAFFIWQELQNDVHQSNRYVVRAFRKRGLASGFRQAMEDAKSQLKKSKTIDLEAPLVAFHVEMEDFQWNLAQKRSQEIQFDLLADHLTAYFTTQMLRLGYMYRTQQALQKQSPAALPRLETVLRAFPPENQRDSPQIALHYVGYQLLSNPYEDHWLLQFRQLLAQYGSQFSPDEARDHLMLAINHCIRRINQGQRQFIPEVLTFYELGLENLWLLDERGFLAKYTYNNVLLTIIAQQDWQKAESFLERYRAQLPPVERTTVYDYNKAVLLFRKGDYDGAQSILRSLAFADPTYNLEARRMLLRIYFENNEYDALDSLLDNLMTWLRRHGEIGYQREMYRNLARFTGKLLKIPAGEKKKLQDLAQKIKDTPLVADRAWLLKQLPG